MALKGWWGFDSCAVFKYPEFDAVLTTTATGRDGVANHATGVNGNTAATMTIPGGAIAGCVVGAAWLFGTTTISNLLRVAEFKSAGTTLGYVSGTGDGHLGFYSGTGTLMATTSVVFAPGVWHYLEIKFIPHATAGTVIIRSNEVEVLNFTGVTTVGPNVTLDGIVFNARSGASPGTSVDDMYLLDLVDETATAGRANNDWLGDVKVAHLIPTADGATVTMTPSTAGAHFGLVDETPPNTTDYVSALGGGSVKDLYGMSDLLPIATVVFGVRVCLYAAKTDAGAASLKTLIRESVGTETAGPVTPLSVSYAGSAGPFHKAKAAGGTFTPADINAIQAGAQVA